MTRPSFQFYPKDWISNTKLRRCTPAARGVWMDVLCLLHDSDEYGVAHYPLADLANASGAPIKLLLELVAKGVLKGCDKGMCDAFAYRPRSGRKEGAEVTLVQAQSGPIWYSSRMVKDEYVRTHAGAKTRFSNGGDADGGGESSPESRRTRHSLEAPSRSPSHRHGEDQGDDLNALCRSPSRRHGVNQGDGSSSSSSSALKNKRGGHCARASDDPPDEPRDPALDGHARTPAGEVCRAVRAAGIADVNPGHPDLLRLLAAQVPLADVEAAAVEIVAKGKPRFALLLATLEGRLRDAKAKGTLPNAGVPWHETRSGIESKGAELGLGRWDEYAASVGQGEQWPAYQTRVFAKAGRGADGRVLQ